MTERMVLGGWGSVNLGHINTPFADNGPGNWNVQNSLKFTYQRHVVEETGSLARRQGKDDILEAKLQCRNSQCQQKLNWELKRFCYTRTRKVRMTGMPIHGHIISLRACLIRWCQIQPIRGQYHASVPPSPFYQSICQTVLQDNRRMPSM